MAMIPYTYRAIVRRVVDGDTIRVDVDLGLGITFRGEDGGGMSLRLAGCNARELRDPGGAEARLNLVRMLPNGAPINIHTVKVDMYGGRYDAVVEFWDGRNLVDLVDVLVAEEWAVRWDGDGPRPVPPWPRTVP